MSQSVTTIPAKPKMHPLRVGAYCRVSSEADEQTMSFESQIAYYRTIIEENPDWTLVGIYAERSTGTDFENRSQYNRMVKDAMGTTTAELRQNLRACRLRFTVVKPSRLLNSFLV